MKVGSTPVVPGYAGMRGTRARRIRVYLEERRSIHLFSTLANYLRLSDILMCPYKSAFGPAVALEQVRTHPWFLRYSLISASSSEKSRQ